MVVKTGAQRWQRALVPMLPEPKSDPSDLYARCRNRWARKRSDIEADIKARQAIITGGKSREDLNGWD